MEPWPVGERLSLPSGSYGRPVRWVSWLDYTLISIAHPGRMLQGVIRLIRP